MDRNWRGPGRRTTLRGRTSQCAMLLRTVKWHLRHVFTKVGIKSRRDLASLLPQSESEVAVA